MPLSDPRFNEEEVLLAFSVEPKHDRATLEYYLAKYPEHAAALVDCALELMMLPAEVSPIWVADSAVESGWQQFRSLLGVETSESAESPFAKLSPSAFKQLAVRLNINNLFLLRIRDRGVRSTSIPGAFIGRLADALGASTRSVATYLEGPPTLATASAFRSNEKPAAMAQVDFAEAVKTSQLTPDQQQTLLAMEK